MRCFRGPSFFVFAFLWGSFALPQEPKRSEKFAGPPRDPPSHDFDSLHLRLDVSFDLERETKRGEELTFSIAYRATPKSGVYFQKPDKTYPDNPRQVWTQGEAEEARHWIPCSDHPSDKLTTELFITAPRPLTAISNGRLVSIEPRGSDAQVFHWV